MILELLGVFWFASVFFFQAEDGIRDLVRSRGLGDVYKRQAANRTIGQGGFQEVEQMALFRDMVCYQEEVRDPVRIAEVLNLSLIHI